MSVLKSVFRVSLFIAAISFVGTISSADRQQRIGRTALFTHSTTYSSLDPELRKAIKSAPDASKWPDNDSDCLRNYADVTIQPDGTMVAEYHRTFKLFNTRARSLGEQEITYNTVYEKMQVLYARTIERNGKVLVVKPDEIRLQSTYSDYPLYEDYKTASFSLPGIEGGCVIDYAWRKVIHPVFSKHFTDYWSFSHTNSIEHEHYVLHVPAGRAFQYRIHNNKTGLKPIITTSSNGRMKTYVWDLKHIQPIEEEPDMPDSNEIYTWLEVSSIPTWQELGRWYGGLVKAQAIPSNPLRTAVRRLTTGKISKADCARAIYDWVANRVRYVGLGFGDSAYKLHPAAMIQEKLYGDCKDKTTLLITMLRLAGIKAYPVLLNSGTNYPIRQELPSIDNFDHCIALAEIEGKEVWLDATAETSAFGDIPATDRGSDAFIIRDEVGHFETIPNYRPEENGDDSWLRIGLHSDGSADVHYEVHMRGGSGQSYRNQVLDETPRDRKDSAQGWVQNFAVGGKLKSYDIPDGVNKTGPYVCKMEFTDPNSAEKAGNLLILPLSYGGSGSSSNYTKEKRKWPIEIVESSEDHTDLLITLPEGYVIEDIPEDVHFQEPIYDYNRHVVVSADARTVHVTIISKVIAGRVPPSEYTKIRAYFDNVWQAADDGIVLRKSN